MVLQQKLNEIEEIETLIEEVEIRLYNIEKKTFMKRLLQKSLVKCHFRIDINRRLVTTNE